MKTCEVLDLTELGSLF